MKHEYDLQVEAANRLRDLVLKRVDCRPQDLQCPRERSDMTPCIARDGGTAVDDEGWCVGCGACPSQLLAAELEREIERLGGSASQR